jgi:chromosome segregation ATPase
VTYVDELISTGVDQLINVVFNKKRVKLEDVANELGISQNVIQEWVKILEDEGLVKMEYSFTTPYLVWAGQDFKEPENLKTVKSDRDVLADEVEGFINKITGELKGVKENKKKLKSLLDQISTFDTNVSKASTNLNSIKKNVTESSESIKKLIKSVEDESNEFDEKYTNYKEKLSSVSGSFKQDSSKIKDLIKNYEIHKSKLDGILTSLNSQLENLTERIEELNEMSSDIDDKLNTYRELESNFNDKFIDNFNTDFKKIGKEYKLVKEGITERLKEMKDALKSVESFTKEVDGLEEKLNDDVITKRYSEVNNLLEMLTGLEKEEEQINKKMNVLLSQLKSLKIEVSPLTNEKAAKIVRDSKGKIKTIKREYTAVEQKKKELMDLVKKIKDEK